MSPIIGGMPGHNYKPRLHNSSMVCRRCSRDLTNRTKYIVNGIGCLCGRCYGVVCHRKGR